MTIAISISRRWAIMIGLRELALVAMVVLVLYGRSGVLKSRRFQVIRPWITPVRRPPAGRGVGSPSTSRSRAAGAGTSTLPVGRSRYFILQGNRLFWFLTILAATAVAAWIITRLLILNGTGPGITH